MSPGVRGQEKAVSRLEQGASTPFRHLLLSSGLRGSGGTPALTRTVFFAQPVKRWSLQSHPHRHTQK